MTRLKGHRPSSTSFPVRLGHRGGGRRHPARRSDGPRGELRSGAWPDRGLARPGPRDSTLRVPGPARERPLCVSVFGVDGRWLPLHRRRLPQVGDLPGARDLAGTALAAGLLGRVRGGRPLPDPEPGTGAAVQRIRVERKKEAAADYSPPCGAWVSTSAAKARPHPRGRSRRCVHPRRHGLEALEPLPGRPRPRATLVAAAGAGQPVIPPGPARVRARARTRRRPRGPWLRLCCPRRTSRARPCRGRQPFRSSAGPLAVYLQNVDTLPGGRDDRSRQVVSLGGKPGREAAEEVPVRRPRGCHPPRRLASRSESPKTTWSKRFISLAGAARTFPYPDEPQPVEPGPRFD